MLELYLHPLIRLHDVHRDDVGTRVKNYILKLKLRIKRRVLHICNLNFIMPWVTFTGCCTECLITCICCFLRALFEAVLLE
jgi:hypothetical protein